MGQALIFPKSVCRSYDTALRDPATDLTVSVYDEYQVWE